MFPLPQAKKYPRNYLLFNLCIVCHPWSRYVYDNFIPSSKDPNQVYSWSTFRQKTQVIFGLKWHHTVIKHFLGMEFFPVNCFCICQVVFVFLNTAAFLTIQLSPFISLFLSFPFYLPFPVFLLSAISFLSPFISLFLSFPFYQPFPFFPLFYNTYTLQLSVPFSLSLLIFSLFLLS